MRRRPTRRAVLAAIPSLAAACRITRVSAAAGPGPLGRSGRGPLAGINLAGAEFGERMPGVHGQDFIHPGPADFDGVAELGLSLVRLPFRWERLEPGLDGRFDPDEWRRIEDGIDAAARRGLVIVLDLHNYARRRIPADGFAEARLIGSADVPVASFSRLWSEIARRTAARPHVAYGLMNEPYDLAAREWLVIANAAIGAIRAAGAGNLVLVPGVAYTGAHSWYAAGNAAMAGVRDPAANFAIEVHQYLDANSSGDDPLAVTSTIGSERLEAFQEWARARGLKAFLGEFGAGRDDLSLAALADLLAEMAANPDVWVGWSAWAAGPWWPDDYGLRLSRDRTGGWPRQSRLIADVAGGRPQRAGSTLQAAIEIDLARNRYRGIDTLAAAFAVERPGAAGAPRRGGRVELFARDTPRLTDLGLLIERRGHERLVAGLAATAWGKLARATRPAQTSFNDMRLLERATPARFALAVEQPGWHSVGLWTRADPRHAARLTLSVAGSTATFDLAAGSIAEGPAMAAMSGAGDLRHLSLSWLATEAGVAALDIRSEQTDAAALPAGSPIEISAPTFEAGPSATHHIAPERAADVVMLVRAAARLAAADRVTVLIETRRLGPAPVRRPLLASSSPLLPAVGGGGALATALGGGLSGTGDAAAARMAKRRYAIALDRSVGRALLAATGAETLTVAFDAAESNGPWRIGGFGDEALDGYITRVALFAEALDASSLAAVVA